MKKITMLLGALLLLGSAAAQIDPMTPIPTDPQIRTGRLENGMTYYIRHNEKPKNQADFYILHNVGAIQEEDTQQGLAHFLEHMAFNGTKNLPGKQLTEYLEKIGVKFGANLNASTGWDRTLYNIKDVPTLREGIIDSALLILHDWSHFIALEPEEIDSERGVIMEELRTRDGAQWRSTMKLLQAVGKDSKYERRNLIGYLEDLKTFRHQELEAFYRSWYRPDYQAVVIVGDVDVDAVERKLTALMSDIPAPDADAVRKEPCKVPDNEQPIISIYTDPEMPGSRIHLIIKREAVPEQINGLVYGEMLSVIEAYMTVMGNARLQELAMQPDAPFLGASLASGDVLGVIPTLDMTIFAAATQDGGLETGFEALCTEAEKIRRYGFTQGEFERAREDLMRQAEQSYANRNDRRNNAYVQACLEHYRKNSPLPDAETEWRLDSMLIQTLDVDAVNAFAQQVITPGNQVIVVSAPEKEGVANPGEAALLAIRERIAASEIAPHEDHVVKEPLVPEEAGLPGSPVVKTEENNAYGTTEWTLANGAKVVLKTTACKADEIRMSARAGGGLSLLSDEEFYMGEMMPAVISMSGAGKFSATELRKQLSGKSVSVQPTAGRYTSGMKGVCSPGDLETMMQLLYLGFTQPRFDENGYNTLLRMLDTRLENARTNPDHIMEERFIDVAYAHNPRRQMISKELLERFDFAALPAIYGKLYPGADSFVFTFAGNVDARTLRPLVEKYIGSIPATGRPTAAADDGCDPVPGLAEEDFRVAMQQPKVSVHYRFTGRMPYTLRNKAALTLLSQALNSRYLTSIREEKGGTYAITVQGTADYEPKETYAMDIRFDTNEEMADELCGIVMQEFEKIAAEGPLDEDIEKTREYLLKNWNNILEQNEGWISVIEPLYGSGLDYLADYEQTLRSMTKADVQEIAGKILADGNLVKVIMRPETAETK